MINPDTEPNITQDISPFQVSLKILTSALTTEKNMVELRDTIKALSESIALNTKKNIETMMTIERFIQDQMMYRAFRQDIEENNLLLQLTQRTVELEFLDKKVKALEAERESEDAETDGLKLEYEKQKLEIDNLRSVLELIKTNKKDTGDRIQAVANPQQTSTVNAQKIRDTIVLTAVSVITAAVVGGFIAFVVWLFRFYIQNTPS